ncbi:hypothetical protein [Phaeobacter sp.]|uniref:hypothetical protein n=1 Tax=Phaeobacter sp. TaxID=1902409 RepID=UPI0025D679C3|nr:hypothetical protein [Phaeobacter sp.]
MFNALPKQRSVQTQLDPSGQPLMVFPGRTVLFDDMKSALNARANHFWHPGGSNQKLRNFTWIVNMLADADHYETALEFLAHRFADRTLPIFNRPEAILRSRRDRVWQHLDGIDNLICPQCIRFSPEHPEDFVTVFADNGFTYPVLLRPQGSHSGKHLLKIDSPADWDKLHSIPWGGRGFYMTQWVDFQSSPGEWRKLRLAITPDRVRLRHILFSDSWLIHSALRDEDIVKRELEVLRSANEWAELQAVGAAIRDRLPLDFFGVDLGWRADGQFVLFEANASMSILSYHNMPEFHQEVYRQNINSIETDVWRALQQITGIQAPSGL